MLTRFSLYGFLKNQQYYEPFLILAFVEKGLSFFQIGLLIGFRELCINLFEIPSGAAADMYGRRRTMIFSMGGYIVSFIIFGGSESFVLLFAAMLFFAIGDAFRTGTHKAMIFEWLRSQGRTNEKTRVYGYTRSWSKIGSAVSVIIAAGLVFYTGRYSHIFWFSIPPYLFNVINFFGYPAYLDGDVSHKISFTDTVKVLWRTLKESARNWQLRRLFLETMGFEGSFKVTKGYLQPLLKQAALTLPFFLWLEANKRSAILVGFVYFVLYLFSMIAARHSHRFSERMGGEHQAAGACWKLCLLLFFVLLPSMYFQWNALAILLFVSLEILQNIWRPVQVTRFDVYSDSSKGATILSIESQAKSIFTMLAAPLLGFTVDSFGLWVVSVLGIVITVAALLTSPWNTQAPPHDKSCG